MKANARPFDNMGLVQSVMQSIDNEFVFSCIEHGQKVIDKGEPIQPLPVEHQTVEYQEAWRNFEEFNQRFGSPQREQTEPLREENGFLEAEDDPADDGWDDEHQELSDAQIMMLEESQRQ